MSGLQPRSWAIACILEACQAGESESPTYKILPARTRIIERAEYLLYRCATVPHVKVQEIDVVSLESSQTVLHRLNHVLAMVAAGVGVAATHGERVLRGQHQLLAATADELPQEALRAAVA